MDILEHIDIPGFQSISMKSMILIDLRICHGKFLDIHGNPWVSMDIHDIYIKEHGVFWPSGPSFSSMTGPGPSEWVDNMLYRVWDPFWMLQDRFGLIWERFRSDFIDLWWLCIDFDRFWQTFTDFNWFWNDMDRFGPYGTVPCHIVVQTKKTRIEM